MTTPYQLIRDDLYNGNRQWREIPQELAIELLEAVPPIRQKGFNFVMGEAQTITEEGDQIYFVSLLQNGKHWGIMATLAEFDSGSLQVGTNPPPLKVFKFG